MFSGRIRIRKNVTRPGSETLVFGISDTTRQDWSDSYFELNWVYFYLLCFTLVPKLADTLDSLLTKVNSIEISVEDDTDPLCLTAADSHAMTTHSQQLTSENAKDACKNKHKMIKAEEAKFNPPDIVIGRYICLNRHFLPIYPSFSYLATWQNQRF